ncbi:hypothetical protein NA57DRAFT_81983 [Rhizodiscina lignyota]|uniref:BZIP domain-containing protein n=1 Tax=Rhizodiscina lignyota TaxID=1504668 RepID=A0A9P4I377_9PEZI|nr:hypothetical protein NA57DRAFT_81983 [Rhizodiscina lignyota]
MVAERNLKAEDGIMEEVELKRLKKREIDRRSQRLSRERKRSRLAQLESLVEASTQQDTSGKIAALVAQLEKMTTERDDLLKTLKGIQLSVQGHFSGPSDPKQTPDSPATSSVPAEIDSKMDQVSVFKSCTPDNTLSESPESDFKSFHEANKPIISEGSSRYAAAVVDFGLTSANTPLISNVSPPKSASSNVYLPDYECCHPPERTSSGRETAMDCWGLASQAMGHKLKLTQEILRVEDALADDVPVRAVAEGWAVVEAQGKLTPLWSKLRNADEWLFGHFSPPLRLASLKIMHLLLRYHADPSPERLAALPPWYIPRPSQRIAHSYAIDFFAWPGLRERLIFAEQQYCTDFFWELFSSKCLFLWPFELRDCYSRDTLTSQYHYSPSFLERIADIKAWSMDSDFFQPFPELYSDIPVRGSIPQSLLPVAYPRIATAEVSESLDGSNVRANNNRAQPCPASSLEYTPMSSEGFFDAQQNFDVYNSGFLF